MAQVLFIEDDKDIGDPIQIHLTDDHFDVEQVYDGRIGLNMALAGGHDLVILDLMLPELDGLVICRRIRKSVMQVPILMLTSRSEESDKVLGLETGADDYLTKPFSVRELMARVKAILRRSAAPQVVEGAVQPDIVRNDLH